MYLENNKNVKCILWTNLGEFIRRALLVIVMHVLDIVRSYFAHLIMRTVHHGC